MQDKIAAFLAPDGYAFEDAQVDTPVADPTILSTHGFKVGAGVDDRFCLFYGQDIPQQIIASAEAVQIAPTLAKIIGVRDAQFSEGSLV